MKTEKAIKFYGSQVALAKALGVSKQAVGRWKRQGLVSETYAWRLQVLTLGKLKVNPRLYA